MLAETAVALRRNLPSFKKLFFLTVFYAALAFAYSSIGFLHPQVAPHYNEYNGLRLVTEIAGHFSFGIIAAIPLLDIQLALLTGTWAVLIDSDHMLSSLGFNISGRPDHSFLFILVSAVFLFLIAKRYGGFTISFLTKFAYLAPIVLFSHIAFDIFAGGPQFQLLIPFSFQSFTLPYHDWMLFEAIALVLSCLGYFSSLRWKVRPIPNSGKEKQSTQLP